MTEHVSRRRAMGLMAASLLAARRSRTAETTAGRETAGKGSAGEGTAGTKSIAKEVVGAHDERLERLLDRQVVDPESRWRGGIPDRWGLHHAGSAGGLIRDGIAAYVHPGSRYHRSAEVRARLELATAFLARAQGPDGNIDLLTTNFNSPPDTGFLVHNVAAAARIARTHGADDLESLLEGFLRRAGEGMARGGIHTPNHRWVVCAALAQIHDLYPEDRLVRRIDEWLAEGIDIDAEGQFTERSTTVYNAVTDNALVVLAHKLRRPELLEPARRNLEAMAWLLHDGGEVVTEISRRQDLNTRGTMARYWFALRYLALRDGSGTFAAMLAPLEPERIRLAALLEYPELREDPPAPAPLPTDFEKSYPLAKLTRIRRGRTSITILHEDRSRWLSVHHGGVVIEAVRFASAFFGKGQFVPTVHEVRDGAHHFRQELEGPYYQPLADPGLLPVRTTDWSTVRGERRRTEVCRLVHEATVRESDGSLEITISATGTDHVPVAIEICFREGGRLTGAVPAPAQEGAYLLAEGSAEYRVGSDAIRLGPGRREHAYTRIRGAEDPLPGPAVYLTGYTPLRHTLRIRPSRT